MSIEDTIIIQSESRKSRIKLIKLLLILLNVILYSVGTISGTILVRLYFLHGGARCWLTAWILTSGFPILLIPIFAQPFFTKTASDSGRPGFLLLPPKLIAATGVIGIMLSICGFLFSFAVLYLPVSVFSLLGSTQLAFTAVAAYFVVKQRFTVYSINAVVMMMLGSVIIGIHVDGEKPVGTSAAKYVLGIFLAILGSALHGFMYSVVEFVRIKSGLVMSFGVLMQLQFFILMFATVFCTIPILINGDFQAMSEEAAAFGLGKNKYYMILVLATLVLQLMIIGSLGLIFISSSLFSSIIGALLVPAQQIFAVIFLHETFSSDKGVSLAACLWGFASYSYGVYKSGKKTVDDKQESATPNEEGVVV